MIPAYAISIRPATDSDHDQRVLCRLAALDSRPRLRGPAVIAEVDGVARAALDLSNGSVAADPFVPTAELVELLRVRAGSFAASAHAGPVPEARRRWLPARAA